MFHSGFSWGFGVTNVINHTQKKSEKVYVYLLFMLTEYTMSHPESVRSWWSLITIRVLILRRIIVGILWAGSFNLEKNFSF